MILDGRTIPDRQVLHETLARSLSFPDWYGGNLDALSDCLTSLSQDTTLILRHTDALETALGPYVQRFLRVLNAAEAETPRLTLRLEP